MVSSAERMHGAQVKERRPSRTDIDQSNAGRRSDGWWPHVLQEVVVVMPIDATDAASRAGYVPATSSVRWRGLKAPSSQPSPR